MGYYIDLASIRLEHYKAKLATAYLPPSRMILKERLDERFDHFHGLGIKNVEELRQTLRKKDKRAELSQVECFSGDYLKILLREVNSTLPKPNRIKEFPGISAETALKLEKIGIKNTPALYDKVKTCESRKELSDATGINESEILELAQLTDLSRIKWVGVTFARMLYDLGIDTVKKASKADPVDLHKKINQLNKEQGIYRGQIGLRDIKIFINAAGEVPLDIEY